MINIERGEMKMLFFEPKYAPFLYCPPKKPKSDVFMLPKKS